jgi:signal transduction histidine kinase
MGLDAVSNTVEHDPSRARLLVERLRERSQEALDTVRAVTHGLRPPVLDDLGLIGALQQHAEQLTTPDHSVAFSADPGAAAAQLPAAVELATYNLCMEAMANATRHAAASRTTVRLERTPLGLRVTVTDDGIGISSNHHPGVGLRSMRSRVEELGGTFSIEPGQDRGTRVVADLPLGVR